MRNKADQNHHLPPHLLKRQIELLPELNDVNETWLGLSWDQAPGGQELYQMK